MSSLHFEENYDKSNPIAYEALAVVIDENGDIYVAKKDVLAGIELTNTEYWIKSEANSKINIALAELHNNIEKIKTLATKEYVEQLIDEIEFSGGGDGGGLGSGLSKNNPVSSIYFKDTYGNIYKTSLLNGVVRTENVSTTIKVLSSITASKTKKTYALDEAISLSDVTVTATYTDGTNKTVTEWTSNINEITTFTDGIKRLVISYTLDGITKKTTILLSVSSNSVDNTQYAYCINGSGRLVSNTNVIKLTAKLFQGAVVNVRYKMKIIIDRNTNNSYTTIGLGNYSIWGTANIGSKLLNPYSAGEYIIEVNESFTFSQENVNYKNDVETILFKLYHNGGYNLDGTFELLEYLVTVTTVAPILLKNLALTKTTVMYFDGETINTDDVSVTAYYTNDTSKAITSGWTSNASELGGVGATNLVVSYTDGSITKTASIKLTMFKADLTKPLPFNDINVYDLNNSINFGINLGNCFDSAGNTTKTCGNDMYLEQENAWGQPDIIQKTIDDIIAEGFNTVRIPVTWYYNSYLDSDDNRRIGRFWQAKVRDVIDLALDSGLYVIMNCHHEQAIFFAGVSDTKMERVILDVKGIWGDIAEKFKYYGEKLIFEAFNEVDNLESSWTYGEKACRQMNLMNQTFVDTVRATGGNNTKRILIVPTLLDGANTSILNDFVLPTDTVHDKLMVQVHTYSSLFIQDIEMVFTRLENFSNRVGVPVIIGEYGTIRGSLPSDSLRGIHASNYVARAKYHGIKTIWWDNGSDYTIIPRPNPIYTYTDTYLHTDILDGIRDGYNNNVAYCIPNENLVIIDSMDGFTYLNTNLETGELYNSFWGTLSSNLLPIKEGNTLSILLECSGTATKLKMNIAYTVYYDVNGDVLSSITHSYMSQSSITTIPSDAVALRVVLNSPHNNVSLTQYQEMFNSSDLKFIVSNFVTSDIAPITLQSRILSSISATKTTKKYEVDGTINVDDITVTATYDDGYSKVVSGWTTNVTSLTTVDFGIQTLVITYKENGITKTYSIELGIGAEILSSISATKTITTYNSNDVIDTSDITVIATYSDGLTATITTWTSNVSTIDTSITGTKTLTISYSENGVTKTVDIPILIANKITTTIASWNGESTLPDNLVTYSSTETYPIILTYDATNDSYYYESPRNQNGSTTCGIQLTNYTYPTSGTLVSEIKFSISSVIYNNYYQALSLESYVTTGRLVFVNVNDFVTCSGLTTGTIVPIVGEHTIKITVDLSSKKYSVYFNDSEVLINSSTTTTNSSSFTRVIIHSRAFNSGLKLKSYNISLITLA